MTEKKRDWLVHWVITLVGYLLFGFNLHLAVVTGFVGMAGLLIGALLLHTMFVVAGIRILRREHG